MTAANLHTQQAGDSNGSSSPNSSPATTNSPLDVEHHHHHHHHHNHQSGADHQYSFINVPTQHLGQSSVMVDAATRNEQECIRVAALIKRTGYSLKQENGQRKMTPPPEWNLPPPERGSEVFVGKIPRDMMEDELFPLFERIGTMYKLRLMMDFSCSNRGYAFVTYTSRQDAKRACSELNNYEIRPGRHIGVVLSVDNCRLFVGGIPRTVTKQEVLAEMSKVTNGVQDVILYASATDKNKNRGFAFVEYATHELAAKARRQLLPNGLQLWNSTIAVDWAEPEPEVDEAIMANVRILYVRNLMVHTTEEELRELFERAVGEAGPVERVKIMKDYAFVHFVTREQAAKAREMLNGTELHGAIIQVEWAKPADRSNIMRCVKNLQKSGSSRRPGQPESFLPTPGMHVYSDTSSQSSPTVANVDLEHAASHAAALTGYPCIDPYTGWSQALLERQTSANGGCLYLDNSGFLHSMGRNRSMRGAAGMRSAGFQAMVNNSVRQSSRRKMSEQILCNIMLNQQQSPMSAQPPSNVVLIPDAAGHPQPANPNAVTMPFWRPTLVQVVPAAPLVWSPTGAAPPTPAVLTPTDSVTSDPGMSSDSASTVPASAAAAAAAAPAPATVVPTPYIISGAFLSYQQVPEEYYRQGFVPGCEHNNNQHGFCGAW